MYHSKGSVGPTYHALSMGPFFGGMKVHFSMLRSRRQVFDPYPPRVKDLKVAWLDLPIPAWHGHVICALLVIRADLQLLLTCYLSEQFKGPPNKLESLEVINLDLAFFLWGSSQSDPRAAWCALWLETFAENHISISSVFACVRMCSPPKCEASRAGAFSILTSNIGKKQSRMHRALKVLSMCHWLIEYGLMAMWWSWLSL